VRIVVVDKDKCHPEKCGWECLKYCPVARQGKKIIEIEKRAKIDESLCIGCGICVHKCPFKAISIVNLPEAVGEPVHRYGRNGFALFGLPIPGESVGLLGPNGIGKTTIVRIFSGQLIPNLGREKSSWDDVIERFAGTEIGEYLKKVADKEIRVSVKPQNITDIPKLFKESVGKLLGNVDERGKLGEIVDALELQPILNKTPSELSGGELQKVAIAACLAKDADIYFIDEPGSFLDIYERIRVSDVIREFARRIFVVEHDLLMLDYLTDEIHVMYGQPGVYGIVSMRKSTRVGVNEFIEGYLRAENMRIREEPLKFLTKPPSEAGAKKVVEFRNLRVRIGTFELFVEGGDIREKEIVGIAGRNALGKTTFVKVLAGLIKPEGGTVKGEVKVSYKPQYVEAPELTVGELFRDLKVEDINVNRDLLAPLQITHLLRRKASELSGGELQRVAIALALAREADLYLIDEPSAFLDSEQRIRVARVIRKVVQTRKKAALVVEHDLMLLDYLSDRLMVFTGEPGRMGIAKGPMDVGEGMKIFLKSVDLTLRRDPETKRPRINKRGSKKDRELRARGEWYEKLS